MAKTAKQRIEKAKKAYGLAESWTDRALRWLADHPFTLGLIVLAVAAVLLAWWFV